MADTSVTYKIGDRVKLVTADVPSSRLVTVAREPWASLAHPGRVCVPVMQDGDRYPFLAYDDELEAIDATV